MVRTSLSRYLWWVGARMGLCLAGIGDDEVQRLRFRRLRVISPISVGAVLLTFLGGALTAGLPRGNIPATRSFATALQIGSYIVAGVMGLAALAVLIYARIIVRRALGDRSTDPIARRATLRGFISALRLRSPTSALRGNECLGVIW
jgi:nitrate reductase gamma subunit